MKQEDSQTHNLGLLRGIKIAQVVSNRDPKLQERILVRVLGVHNINNTEVENSIWAHHCAPTRDASGNLPETGDYVYVMFPDVTNPLAIIWLGYVRSSFQTLLKSEAYKVEEEPDSVTDHAEHLPKNLIGI